jgi:anti-sigma regulatory factor (Ser/Thr protein kinase)
MAMSLGPNATAECVAPSGGFCHDVGFYASDAELCSLVVPFVEEGLAAGEHVVLACDPATARYLRRQLGGAFAALQLLDASCYDRPSKTLAHWRGLAEGSTRAGAARLRVVGVAPHLGQPRAFVGWDRYEAAIDETLGDVAMWGRCLYDLRLAPLEVVTLARRCHRYLAQPSRCSQLNARYDPPRHLGEFLCPPRDPLESLPADLELSNPLPGEVRASLRALAGGRFSSMQLDDMCLAATEAVTNAYLHGMPPVRVGIWVARERMVVVVQDAGSGPSDPLVGLRCRQRGDGGRGLWLMHQLEVDVALIASADGFTARLSAGRNEPGLALRESSCHEGAVDS